MALSTAEGFGFVQAALLAILAAYPNVLVLTTPFAATRPFGERRWYSLLLVLACADTLYFLPFLPILTVTHVYVVWTLSIAIATAAFLVDHANIAWKVASKSGLANLGDTIEPTFDSPLIQGAIKFDYDLFLSYSSRPDYSLVRQLESFLESFHLSARRRKPIQELRVCTDISDFRLENLRNRRESETLESGIDKKIEENLYRSELLLVLCCKEAAKSKWVDFEIDKFLSHQGPGAVLLAVTGGDPQLEPQRVFPKRLLELGLQDRRSWYDFRRVRYRYRLPGSPAKNFDDERVRLVMDLVGQSVAGSVSSIWLRDQHRRRLRILVGGIFFAMLALASAWKGTELLLQLDAFRFESESIRLSSLNTLIKWYSLTPRQLSAFTARDNPEQLFRLLTGGCDSDVMLHRSDQVRRVGLALADARVTTRGLVMVTMDLEARFGRFTGRVPSGGEDIFEVLPSLRRPPDDPLTVPRDGSRPGFVVLREPLWGDSAHPDSRAALSVIEAFDRAEGVGHVPTIAQLRRAYRIGLEPLPAEWCRYDPGTPAKACEVCRMINGQVDPIYPFSQDGDPPKAAVRILISP